MVHLTQIRVQQQLPRVYIPLLCLFKQLLLGLQQQVHLLAYYKGRSVCAPHSLACKRALYKGDTPRPLRAIPPRLVHYIAHPCLDSACTDTTASDSCCTTLRQWSEFVWLGLLTDRHRNFRVTAGSQLDGWGKDACTANLSGLGLGEAHSHRRCHSSPVSNISAQQAL